MSLPLLDRLQTWVKPRQSKVVADASSDARKGVCSDSPIARLGLKAQGGALARLTQGQRNLGFREDVQHALFGGWPGGVLVPGAAQPQGGCGSVLEGNCGHMR